MNEHVNENILKFYNIKLADHEDYKKNLKATYSLTDEGVEIARNIYRARYNMITIPYYERRETDPIVWQSAHTSDICLRVFLGDKYDDDLPGRLIVYDEQKSHLLWIEHYIGDETAILIRDDDSNSIGLGIITNKEPEYFELSHIYCGPLGYIDFDWEPDEEKKEKCMKFWHENGMIKE